MFFKKNINLLLNNIRSRFTISSFEVKEVPALKTKNQS